MAFPALSKVELLSEVGRPINLLDGCSDEEERQHRKCMSVLSPGRVSFCDRCR